MQRAKNFRFISEVQALGHIDPGGLLIIYPDDKFPFQGGYD